MNDEGGRRGAGVGSIALAGSIPLVLLGNALILMLIPWMADVQYALPGFPDDTLGLAGGDRAGLAHTGIRSIWPVGEGTALLDAARLPDGSMAFQAKETRHMADVRELVQAATAFWLAALFVGGASAFILRRIAPGRIRPALGLGARLTLVLMLAVAILMAIGFETFFDGFHSIFFEGDSWRFKDYFTLRRIYPDEFWGIAAAFFAILTLAQALLLSHLTTGLPRLSRKAQTVQADQ